MANKYISERNYLQTGGKYDCQQVSRGYRQNRDTSTGKQRTTQKSSSVNPPSHCNKEQESGHENEKQCQYLKYPLPRVPIKSKPSAGSSHQCQVNTPRYYKQKPHRHPSALSIPLLSRPESEIHLKARTRTKMADESTLRDKRKRGKQRSSKHQIDESSQHQKNLKQVDVTSLDRSSDEDDLRSVSLRAYSSGCLSVDISNQVGDLVKAFNTVSKRHKVKKIVYEEIEPLYSKCELQQLKPQKKSLQRRLKNHLQKPEQSFDCDPDLLEVLENEEDLESKCTCNDKENLVMENTRDQEIGEKKDAGRLEKLFFEVFAQNKVEGLSKQKKLNCLQDAYNQYSAALEDFSNNQEIYSADCILQQQSSQPNYITQENTIQSENCEQETEFQSNAEANLKAGRRYRHVQNREDSPDESVNGDGNLDNMNTCNQQEPIQVMQCTCQLRNDGSNSAHLKKQHKNVNTNYKNFPYSQIDFSQMFANQRQNILLEMDTAESNFENTNIHEKDTSNVERSDVTDNCSPSNLKSQKQNDSHDSGITRALTSRLSNQLLEQNSRLSNKLQEQNSKLSNQLQEQNENIKGSVISCSAPPKLSISDDHFRSDNRHHYCGHLQCFQRSKSKGVEIANMEKRQTMKNKSKEGHTPEVQNLMYNQESPIICNDFPSEVPNSNRSRTQIDHSLLQPRKPNYDTEIRSADEINRSNDNDTYNNRTNSIENLNFTRPNNNATGADNIGFNPFLNFLLQNDSNYNIPNIIPESQNVYFCDVTTPNLQQQYNIQQNSHEGCDDQNTYTKKQEVTHPFQDSSNANFLLNRRSSTGVAKWHEIENNNTEENQICSTGNEDNQDNQMNNDYCESARRILDEVRESMATNSNENRRIKPSECSFEQINKTCSDQSSYKNYIESIIDNSTDILANNTQASALIQSHQGSKCQTNLKMEAETATDLNMDDSASQVDSRLNQEISQRLNDRLVQSENGMSPASLVTLEEPEYLQHLKKLRWDHLRHISREVHRLENLERFLDSCGCGHMMIHKGMT